MNPFEIDDLLDTMAAEGRVHFAPAYVCGRLGVEDVRGVTDYLLSLVNRKVVSYWEVECPNHDSDFVVEDPSNLPNEVHTCHLCGVEYIPSPDRVWLAFDFTAAYSAHIAKKKETSLTVVPAPSRGFLHMR